MQNIKKFGPDFKDFEKTLIKILKDLSSEELVINLFGIITKELPDSVYVSDKNIEGMERIIYNSLVDLTDKEKKVLNDWILATYSSRRS